MAEVTLVDRNASHLWKPRLHEVGAGLAGAADDETSYLTLGHRHGFEFCLGELVGWSRNERSIVVDSVTSALSEDELLERRIVPYDTLVFALGSRVNDFGISGVREHCHMLDSTEQALRLQRCFLEAAVKASAGKLARVRIGIVGAGATGVELAAEFHHAGHTMELYGGLGAAGKLDITLIDRSTRVLPAVDPRTSASAQKALQQRGIKVLLGQQVSQVSKDGLLLASGDKLPCDIMVWSSGIVGHPVMTSIGLPTTKGNRVDVDDCLACAGVPDVYAIGDCAAAPSADGKGVLPPTAQVAHQQAEYLARALKHRIQGAASPPFVYRPRGTLVSLGAREAAAEFEAPIRQNRVLPAHGAFAKLLYAMLHHAHRVTLHGAGRATALFFSDRLRRAAFSAVKLH